MCFTRVGNYLRPSNNYRQLIYEIGKMYTWNLIFFTVFLKNRNISSKIKRSKVTDYAALSCTTMFCLLWRLVKSWNLWVATSLPESAVWTAISARQFYTKIFEPVVAYALGSVYLLCARTCGWSSYQSCLESPAPGFAKGWQRALAFTIVRHSVGESSCQLGPVYCLFRLPTG